MSRLRPVSYVSFTSPKKSAIDEKMNSSQSMIKSPESSNHSNKHFNYSTFSPKNATNKKEYSSLMNL